MDLKPEVNIAGRIPVRNKINQPPLYVQAFELNDFVDILERVVAVPGRRGAANECANARGELVESIRTLNTGDILLMLRGWLCADEEAYDGVRRRRLSTVVITGSLNVATGQRGSLVALRWTVGAARRVLQFDGILVSLSQCCEGGCVSVPSTVVVWPPAATVTKRSLFSTKSSPQNPAMDKENMDIEERIRLLKEERKRKQAMIDRLREDNQRMDEQTRRWRQMTERLEAEVEKYTREHLPGPSGSKKK